MIWQLTKSLNFFFFRSSQKKKQHLVCEVHKQEKGRRSKFPFPALEMWLSSWVYLLLFQRTWVWFQNPPWAAHSYLYLQFQRVWRSRFAASEPKCILTHKHMHRKKNKLPVPVEWSSNLHCPNQPSNPPFLSLPCSHLPLELKHGMTPAVDYLVLGCVSRNTSMKQ